MSLRAQRLATITTLGTKLTINYFHWPIAARNAENSCFKTYSRRIGSLFVLFYILIPLEGVLRKWVFSDIERVFGFIRDPVLLSIYFIYICRVRAFRRGWASAYLLIATVFVVLSALQTIYYDLPLIAPILGLRAYVLYVPLAFILGECLEEADIRRFIIISLYISIPTALLVYMQFTSSPSDFINKGTSDDAKSVAMVAGDIVRPYGPFTFSQAQATFSVLNVAVLAVAWENRRRFKLSKTLLMLGIIAIMTMGALCGARTFFGSSFIICGAYVLSGLTSGHARVAFVRLGSVVVLVAAFLIVFILVFPTAFEAMSTRQADAEASEGSTVGRALGAFIDGAGTIMTAPMFGYGIGAGNNGVQQILDKGGLEFGETEGAHMINELGPLFGTLTLFGRFVMSVWIGWRLIRINRVTGDGASLIMFGFSGYLLFYAQITLQNQLLSFCWMSIGVTMAMSRISRERLRRATTALRHTQ